MARRLIVRLKYHFAVATATVKRDEKIDKDRFCHHAPCKGRSAGTASKQVMTDTIYDIALLHLYRDPSVICRTANQASH